ncbi:MAG TPA: cutinase family protein, partial [Mycobacterium sp.]|nr:cutinase family protein [Mycobacterium sp.]
MSVVGAFLIATAGLIAPAALPAPGVVPSASAACLEVEVIFARGRVEPAGVGILGNAFVNALKSKSNKNIGVYAVRYPADSEIDIGAND